jgi:hypothetical protein
VSPDAKKVAKEENESKDTDATDGNDFDSSKGDDSSSTGPTNNKELASPVDDDKDEPDDILCGVDDTVTYLPFTMFEGDNMFIRRIFASRTLSCKHRNQQFIQRACYCFRRHRT